jgi:subtilase family serine protease
MPGSRTLITRLGIALTAAATIGAACVAAATHSNAATRVAHRIQVHPQVGPAVRTPGGTLHFACQDRPLDGSQGPRCYQPAQIRTAYNVAPLINSGIDGRGRTIVIVDAYDNPYIGTDLQIFDATFGLPAANFTKVAPYGVPAFDVTDGNMVGWAEETTLDVLWAHAIAPAARILLVQASSNNDPDIYAATKWAVDNNVGDVISQSFGEAETCVDPALLRQEHAMFAEAQSKGMTVFASSGDSGAAQFDCAGENAILAASSPASDPLVTGVGGTTLNASSLTGSYLGETAWTEPTYGCNPPALAASDINCSGGGFSTLYARPAFQSQANRNSGRGVPDVSYDAGVSGGVLTHCAVCNVAILGQPADAPLFFTFGGTSAGSPQWAGLAAIGDQLAGRRLGNINPSLYQIARSPAQYAGALHDITRGNNDVAEIGTGYSAGRGWDPVTGLGSPNALVLLPLLAQRARS